MCMISRPLEDSDAFCAVDEGGETCGCRSGLRAGACDGELGGSALGAVVDLLAEGDVGRRLTVDDGDGSTTAGSAGSSSSARLDSFTCSSAPSAAAGSRASSISAVSSTIAIGLDARFVMAALLSASGSSRRNKNSAIKQTAPKVAISLTCDPNIVLQFEVPLQREIESFVHRRDAQTARLSQFWEQRVLIKLLIAHNESESDLASSIYY